MSNSSHVIEGGYLRDILDQPRALEDTLAAWRFRRGCGMQRRASPLAVDRREQDLRGKIGT